MLIGAVTYLNTKPLIYQLEKAVTYLNTKPLIYQLEKRFPQGQLVFDLPSRLADALARRELDVALIPSVEYLREPRYRIVSDACIACRGPVLSVKLFSRVEPEQIGTLALDEGSRTSAVLVQILLRERYGLAPELVPLPLGADLDEAEADAVLLIGDRAIRSPAGRFEAVWDLGDQWCRWAELPFVFAMWVARDDAQVDDLENALSAARDQGVKHLPAIAEAEAARHGLSVGQCLHYLRDNLHFVLGDGERRGLQQFSDHACRLGLVSPAARPSRARPVAASEGCGE